MKTYDLSLIFTVNNAFCISFELNHCCREVCISTFKFIKVVQQLI